MSRTLILAGESNLAAGIGNSTTVGSATVVRVLNDSGSTVVVHLQDSSFSGIGSFTMLDGKQEFIEKKGSDLLYVTGANVKVAKVGFTA